MKKILAIIACFLFVNVCSAQDGLFQRLKNIFVEHDTVYIYVDAIEGDSIGAELGLPDGDGEDDPADEDDVEIPAWMVPPIKERIMKNELAFMLNRPSDDSNNATLASVKPHGPQDDEE